MTSPIYLYSSTTTSEQNISNGANRDFLDDVLSALRVGDSKVGIFDFSAPWALKIENEVPVVCTIIEGSLWVNGSDKAQHFKVGDTFIMPHGSVGAPYFISSSDTQPSSWITPGELLQQGTLLPLTQQHSEVIPQRIQWGPEGGEIVRTLSFTFKWVDRYYGPLIEALPNLMRIDASDIGAKLLDLMLTSLFTKAEPDAPGFATLAAQTAQMYLIHNVRSFAMNQGEDGAHWLKGLADQKLAKALACIHREPGTKWTVQELGKVAGMSRSSFAHHFSSIMGETPMDYLCSWRMHLARLSLVQGETNVAALGEKLGYQSESAFRLAFRKNTGQNIQDFAKGL